MNTQITDSASNDDRGQEGFLTALRWSSLCIYLGSSVYAYWGYGPHGLLVAMLIALPWLTLWSARSFKLPLGITKSQDRYLGLLMPGVMLWLFAYFDTHSVGWSGPVASALVGAVLLTFCALLVDPGLYKRSSALVIFAVAFGLYGYGAGMEINALLDFKPGRLFRVEASDKDRRGVRGYMNFYLTIEPWGPMDTEAKVVARSKLYFGTKVGDSMCANLREGALKIPWYALSRCSDSAAP